MRAITLLQPWASFVAFGWKRVETRSWATTHRGTLAIHASASGRAVRKRGDVEAMLSRARIEGWPRWAEFADFPLGKVVAVVTLTSCVEMTPELIASTPARERELGDWRPGRFALGLERIRRLVEPVPAKGALGCWSVPWELENALLAAREVEVT